MLERFIREQGKRQAKTQKEYLCKRGEEERGFTADEFKVVKTQFLSQLNCRDNGIASQNQKVKEMDVTLGYEKIRRVILPQTTNVMDICPKQLRVSMRSFS